MPSSTITSKYQTTVPKEIRDRLRLDSGDVLIWELDGEGARVRPAVRQFLELQGSIKVGPGSAVEDVRRARLMRGLEP